MLVRCNKYKAKFCRGSSCEHYYPHEFQAGDINKSWDSKCDNGMCEDNDNKFHAVKCVEWIERK